ncbi:MAG: hypothetical protein IJD24_06405 [Agathobacter sp.]|nr:hypothetical protein [Agathobacter sp.]
MSLLDWLFKRKKKKVNIEEAAISETTIKPVELKDHAAIRNHVVTLCEQMIDISKDMEDVRREYDRVTSYLNDIQIVEGLEGEQKDQLTEVAIQVTKLINVRNDYLNAEKKISDDVFLQMKELEDEVPAIIKRLKENETYLETVKRDLNRLASEKIEWSVVKQEAEDELREMRKLSQMLLFGFGGIAIIVAGLSIMMKWELLPLLIVALMATLAAAYVMIRMQECATDIKQSEINLNHTIALENRVKIRYVNAKNAVDYTCERFHVRDSKELTYNYEQFIEVCKEKERLKQTNEDLDYFNNRLVRILKGLHLYDAKIWVNYANAVVDPKEMVELKHDLFTRRQSLRSRIEYNLNAIEEMQVEVNKYVEKMGDKSEQVRAILQKVEELNKGIV